MLPCTRLVVKVRRYRGKKQHESWQEAFSLVKDQCWQLIYRKLMGGKWAILATLPFISLFLFLCSSFFHLHGRPAASYDQAVLIPKPSLATKFSLLIGILTRPDNYDRRHFLRIAYGIQTTPIADVRINFVFCNLTKDDQRLLLAMEILLFDDIIILDCFENMNSGKTYTFFSSLPRILSRRYDYVMKADDDVYLRLHPLATSLRPLPRADLYYGFAVSCRNNNPYLGYMSGMGFILSWDLVEWISESSIPKSNTEGPEDRLVGQWLDMGKKAKNRFSNKPAMYDYPGTNGACSHELIPETIAVHRLKRRDRWLDVLRFFNVTQDLRPSKLYHID